MGIEDLPDVKSIVVGQFPHFIPIVERAELVLSDGEHLIAYIGGKINDPDHSYLVYGNKTTEKHGRLHISEIKSVPIESITSYEPIILKKEIPTPYVPSDVPF